MENHPDNKNAVLYCCIGFLSILIDWTILQIEISDGKYLYFNENFLYVINAATTHEDLDRFSAKQKTGILVNPRYSDTLQLNGF
jgi:hypothetical protein